MKHSFALIGSFLLLMMVSRASAIEPGRWVSSDMGAGGWINQVRSGPTGIILANTDLSGTYISRDRGKSWSCIGAKQGLKETHACGLGFDPTNPKVLFIGTEGGIYRSEDGGASFTKVFGWIYCTDIKISSANPDIGYATGMSRHDHSDGQVYKTTDNGRTWTKVSVDLPGHCILEELAIDAKNPDIVWGNAYPGRFAGSIKTLFKSTDGGVNWKEVSKSFRDEIFDFAVDPVNPRIVYVTGPHIGLVKSIDGGATWSGPKTKASGSIFIKRDAPNVVRLLTAWHMEESRDYGETWKVYPNWPEQQFLPGHNWGGAANTRKNDDLSNSDTYFFRNSCWLWASFDGGRSVQPLWTDEVPPGSGHFKNRGIKNTNLWTIALSEADSDVIYAGFWDMGIWRSLDRGQTWESCNNVDLTGAWNTRINNKTKQGCGGNCTSIAADPTRPNIVWASIGGDQWKPQTLYKSTEQGRFDSWVKSSDGLPQTWDVRGLSVDPNSPENQRTLFVTAQGDVYRSTDDGAHWAKMSTGIKVNCTCVDKLNPGRVYASGGDGVFRSDDNGETWRQVGADTLTGASQIVIDPSNKNWIYVACNGEGKPRGLYRSQDGGTTWKQLLEDRYLRAVAVDPTNPMNLYAGSSSAWNAGGYHPGSRGVLVSRDGGATWHEANEGLSWPFVNLLQVSSHDPSFVVAGAPGQGVQVRNFADAALVPPVKKMKP